LNKYLVYLLVIVLLGFGLAAGMAAHHPTPGKLPPSKPPAAKTAAKPVDLARVKPNEAGKVIILEYHDVGNKEGRWEREASNFRADLQRLYKLGYRSVSLRDYINNNINTTAGTSPIILTFDDGTAGQFTYKNVNGRQIVDPNCAVGIMEEFAKTHPDWPLKATFYVYYPVPFRQKDLIEKKLRHIIDAGMDIGNHTYTHTRLDKDSDQAAAKEMALNVKSTLSYAPKAIVDSIALPYGKGPKNKSVLISGNYDGIKYHNIGALLVGAEPAPPPTDAKFNAYKLPRVQAISSELDKWLGYFQRHPDKRYISDGNPNTITVPKALASQVDRSKLGKKVLKVY